MGLTNSDGTNAFDQRLRAQQSSILGQQAAHNAFLGQANLGGLREATMPFPDASKPKTIRDELQAETDDWLKDVFD